MDELIYHNITSDQFKRGIPLEGHVYFLTDKRQYYKGNVSYTEYVTFFKTTLPQLPAINRLYVDIDTYKGYIFNGSQWIKVIDPSFNQSSGSSSPNYSGGGLSFDSGYVDENGLMHLTKDGKDITQFNPIKIALSHNLLNGTDVANLHPISSISGLKSKLSDIDLSLTKKFDDVKIVNKYLYFYSNGVLVSGPHGPIGDGSGSGTITPDTTTIKVTNTTGWLFASVAQNKPCYLSFNWNSLEDGLSTGKGTLKVYSGTVLKSTQSIDQGDISIDVSKWLVSGVNTIKLTVSDVYSASKTLTFTIDVVSMYIKSNFDGTVINTKEIQYYYVPVGAVEKTVYFLLDNKEIGRQVVSLSNQQQDFTIPAQSHGSHTFEVYMTAVIGDSDVESNHLFYDLICVEEGNHTTIIACTFQPKEIEQFDTYTIPYRVYNPQNLMSNISLAADGVTVQELTVDRTEQIWSHVSSEVGDTVLTISCGDVVKTITVPIIKSSVNVSAVSNNLILDLSSYGRNNLEADPYVWESNGISVKFNNFNGTSDLWQLDEDGVTVMRVGGDARMTIPLKLFETDLRVTGWTIEIEFATRAILDYNATIISCMDGGRGIEITSQEAEAASAQSSIGTTYKEEEHIRLTFIIEKRTGSKMMLCYLNGICSGSVAYPDDDDFTQINPAEISIGSSECTVDLYHIRVYTNDLTRHQVLTNWIADTQIGSLRKARWNRNNVYDAYGNIIIEKLPYDLPYMVLKSSVLPQFKGDKKTCDGYYVDPVNPNYSFSFEGAQIDVQGTSSQYYRVKNYKNKFKTGFIDSDGNVSEEYAMNENAVPTDTFTFKADVASSEGANNVVLAKLYNDICPTKTPAMEADKRIRHTIDGHPIVMFWDSGSGPVFLGKYNFNNDKGTEEVFGFADGDESWEFLQNGTDRVGFRSADFSEGSGWEDDFEARYPEDNTDTDRLQAFMEWVISTNTAAATNELLEEAVDFGGLTYNIDSAEYRLAKFIYELEDYADVENSIFYYLFTLVFLCIDQREKNAFLTYIAAMDKWIWLFYDADSTLGIDNKGKLTFNPFLEDIDYTEAGDPVFNGQASVFWTNIRLGFAAEIELMYQEWRTDGLISYDIVKKLFDNHQSKWPEAIFNEDSYKKYLEPWIEDKDSTYLSMNLGKKELQRAWWLFNRFRYLDSKWATGTSMSNRILIRAHALAPVTLMTYVKMYGNVYFNALRVKHRMEAWTEQEFIWDASGAEDAVIGINDADMIVSLGDLSQLMIETIDLSKATHLTYLKLGNTTEGYENKNLVSLTLGNNILLKTIDVRNCTGLNQSIDASGCTNVEEIYFDNTAITGLSLPNGGVLKTLHLPETVVNLTLRNQTALTEFVIPSYSNITTLWLENNSDVIDVLGIFDQIPEKSRVRLINVHMAVDTYDEIVDFVAKLDTMRGLDENAGNVDNAQISGTIYIEEVTQPQLNEIAEWQVRYPSLAVLYSRIETYKVRFWVDGVLQETAYNIAWGTKAEYPGEVPTRPGTDDATWQFVEWDPIPENVIKDMDCYAVFKNVMPTLRRLISGTYSDNFRDDLVTQLAGGSLASLPNLKQIIVPSLTKVNNAFYGNSQNLIVYIPSVESSGYGEFGSTIYGGSFGCLVFRDYKKIGFQFMEYLKKITHMVFEGEVPVLTDSTLLNSVDNIYVRADVYDSTLTATNWSNITDKIHKIEDYPEVYTIGQFDSDEPIVSEIWNDPDAATYLRGELTEYIDMEITKTKPGAFGGQPELRKIVTPNASVASCANSVQYLDSTGVNGFGQWYGINGVKTLIIRNTTKVVTLHTNSGIASSPIANGNGCIFVAASLVESYKSATNWSVYADRIKAIEDYSDDGTVNGSISVHYVINKTTFTISTDPIKDGMPYYAEMDVGDNDTIIIRMNDVDITDDVYSNGIINIPAVSADIMVICTTKSEDMIYSYPENGDIGEIPAMVIDVLAGQQILIEFNVSKQQGYIYDGRGCGSGYYGSVSGSASPIQSNELNVTISKTITIVSDGYIVLGGHKNAVNGSLSPNAGDRPYGYFIGYKIL